MPDDTPLSDKALPPAPVSVAWSRGDLESPLLSATLAPSPDNNQPWLFEASTDGTLTLYHDLSRALPSDVDFMFSMIALGAALENLCLAARQKGWQPFVEYVPQGDSIRGPAEGSGTSAGKEAVATIRFAAGGVPDPLYAFVAERVTCRKAYARQPVAENALRQIEEAASGHPETTLHWLNDREAIGRLAWLVAATDRIRFEYQPFHEELYRQLRFSPQEAESTRDGLDVRTLEVPSSAVWLLRRLRPWRRMRLLNRLGLSKLMSVTSALLVKNSGTVGLLTTGVTTRRGYLDAGRAFQRVWITATRLGLALHPLGSLPIFLSRLTRQNGEGLTTGHRAVLEQVQPAFLQIFPRAAGRGLVLLFRLGEASRPAVCSLRRPVQAVFLP
jgi:hypothetical protein